MQTWINLCNLRSIRLHIHKHIALPLFFPFHLAVTLHRGLTWPKDWHLETAMLKVTAIN